jgi:hypothetical protein
MKLGWENKTYRFRLIILIYHLLIVIKRENICDTLLLYYSSEDKYAVFNNFIFVIPLSIYHRHWILGHHLKLLLTFSGPVLF